MRITTPLPLFEEPTRPALPIDLKRIVFIERTEIAIVRSCIYDTRWASIEITLHMIEAHLRPYRLKTGERYRRRSTLPEAAQLAAIYALRQWDGTE